MKEDKNNTNSIELMLVQDLFKGPENVWYKSNEKKADMLERKLESYRLWASKVVLYLRMRIREEERYEEEKRNRNRVRRSRKTIDSP